MPGGLLRVVSDRPHSSGSSKEHGEDRAGFSRGLRGTGTSMGLRDGCAEGNGWMDGCFDGIVGMAG